MSTKGLFTAGSIPEKPLIPSDLRIPLGPQARLQFSDLWKDFHESEATHNSWESRRAEEARLFQDSVFQEQKTLLSIHFWHVIRFLRKKKSTIAGLNVLQEALHMTAKQGVLRIHTMSQLNARDQQYKQLKRSKAYQLFGSYIDAHLKKTTLIKNKPISTEEALPFIGETTFIVAEVLHGEHYVPVLITLKHKQPRKTHYVDSGERFSEVFITEIKNVHWRQAISGTRELQTIAPFYSITEASQCYREIRHSFSWFFNPTRLLRSILSLYLLQSKSIIASVAADDSRKESLYRYDTLTALLSNNFENYFRSLSYDELRAFHWLLRNDQVQRLSAALDDLAEQYRGDENPLPEYSLLLNAAKKRKDRSTYQLLARLGEGNFSENTATLEAGHALTVEAVLTLQTALTAFLSTFDNVYRDLVGVDVIGYGGGEARVDVKHPYSRHFKKIGDDAYEHADRWFEVGNLSNKRAISACIVDYLSQNDGKITDFSRILKGVLAEDDEALSAAASSASLSSSGSGGGAAAG